MASQLEIEKLVTVGAKLGLKDVELQRFVQEERDRLKHERDEQRQERLEENNRLKLEREEENNRLKLEREEEHNQLKEERADESNRKLAELKLQLDLEELRRNNANANASRNSNLKLPKLPTFNEDKDNIDAYIQRFERFALAQGWNRETHWAINLGALLQGKALFEYSALLSEDALNYDKVKRAVLAAYQLTADGFRKKFRSMRPERGETGTKFYSRLKNSSQRWLELESITTFDHLIDAMLREQFLNCCSREHYAFLTERKPQNIKAMVGYADNYIEAHGGWVPKSNKPFQNKESGFKKVEDKDNYQKSGINKTFTKKTFNCYICGVPGHMARDCRKKQSLAFLSDIMTEVINRKEDENQNENSIPKEDKNIGAFIMLKSDPHIDKANENGYLTLDCGHQVPMLSAACSNRKGTMPVQTGKIGEHTVEVLRDTGCSGVVVNSKFVNESQYTGNYKTCILIDGTMRQFPEAIIEIDTPYFCGSTKALCMNKPVFDLIIGNVEGACAPKLYAENQVKYSNCEGTINEISAKTTKNETDVTAVVQTRGQKKLEDKAIKPLKVIPCMGELITPDILRQKQQGDHSLDKIKCLTKSGDVKISKQGSSQKYVEIDGILYKEFQSTNVNYGDTITQLVVPTELRKQVFNVAHKSMFGGHLGIKKTKDKVTTSFTWPGIQGDITRFCQSCDTCQRTTPKGRTCKVPLGDMPLIEEPFQRVAIDLIGPIHPMTDRGHRYILTLVDFATRYPEAIPLKRIDTETVAEGLLEIYSRLGFPKEVLTDQGTQFISNVMKEVNRLLSIRTLTTTPYHAMCNGLVERFNGTIKAMLKKACEERPKDWDRYVNAILFAYRESPQDSMGFSPFELLYGRLVRGPMAILQELWTGKVEPIETKTTYQYVLDLHDRLEQTCKLAQQHLRKSQRRYKTYYNSKTKARQLLEGDEVLLLLPTDNNKLLLHWKGPFRVIQKLNNLNYKIDFGHRSKTFHINLLKKYYRDSDVSASLMLNPGINIIAGTSVIEEELEQITKQNELKCYSNDELLHLLPITQKEFSDDVHVNPELDNSQQNVVRDLIEEFSDILTDIPGKTTLGVHEIKLNKDEPVRSKPYPLPHALRKEIQNEIQLMLRMGVISHSNSPYASPIVIVKKPDGSKRICSDMRKLNQITVFDAEPIPDQEEIFTQLSKSKYFTKIDLCKGYWQIPMSENSKHLTAFVTPNGLYEYNMMPFGLVNSAQTFSRIMRKLLYGLEGTNNYIDDILIHSENWFEHIKIVREVFERLRQADLKARPTKCFIAYGEVEFLGHVIGQGTMKPRPKKIKAIQEAKRPETKKEVRSFLGLIGYYRRFIADFSTIATPLINMTKKDQPLKINWKSNHEESFLKLKDALSTSPILHLPDLKKEFTLRTDASDFGLGAVLLQEIAGKKFPIAYASKKLNGAQRNYSVMEKECLAIVWALRKFEPYLYGKKFIIETDHQPLTCLRKSKVANGRILRWALALQPFQFHIEVIKGIENVGADYLSRSV